MAKIDIELPDELLLDVIDTVERKSVAGRDANGNAVESWMQTYPNDAYPDKLRATVDLEPAGDPETFGQSAMELRGKAYIGPLPDGTLPDLGIRDRMAYGRWPNGTTRYLTIHDVIDP